MILLDEFANDGGAVGDCVRGKVVARPDAANDFVIGQEDALEDAVLAHQVFIGGDIIFSLFFLCFAESRRWQEKGPGGGSGAEEFATGRTDGGGEWAHGD